MKYSIRKSRMGIFTGAAVLALLVSPGLHAGTIANEVFTFTGNCVDCGTGGGEGAGTGTLTLLGTYNLGDTLSSGVFVSFTYSSIEVPSFSITSLGTLFGTITAASGPENVEIISGSNNFVSFANGAWCLSQTSGCLDTGNVGSSTFTLDSQGVPEPGSFMLMGAGIAALAMLQRRRSAARGGKLD
jgi:hypothetical protein